MKTGLSILIPAITTALILPSCGRTGVDAFAYGSIIVTDNYIVRNAEAISIINKAPVRVFDRHTGRFICNVGHLGRGPGEYLSSYCTFVDEKGGKVWIMNAGDHIKTYDLLSPVFTYDERSLKSGMSLSSTLLPGKVLSHLTEEQETIPNVRVSMPTAMVITDLKSGESVRYGLVMRNDFLGVDAGGSSFQYGYMIQQISAEEFRETGQQALEQGLLSGSAAGQVRAILADLKDTDNDVIMLARLKD